MGLLFSSRNRLSSSLLLLNLAVLAASQAFGRDKFMTPTVPEDSPDFIHLVSDIDRTLVDPEESGLPSDPSRTIEIQGKRYRIADWVEERFTYWADRPQVKVSFISGGDRARNTQLLKAIRLKDGSGRSLYDIAWRIVSLDELKPANPSGGHPSEKLQKDLTTITRYTGNVAMADDKKFYLPLEQRRSLIWTLDTYISYPTFADAQRALRTARKEDLPYIPKTYEEWYRDRNRIARIFEIEREAVEAHLHRAPGDPRAFADRVAEAVQKADDRTFSSGSRFLELENCERSFSRLAAPVLH